MIKATFEKVAVENVRSILPTGSLLPAWTTFNVNIQIPDEGMSSINLFDRYYFEISKQEAFTALATLSH